MRWEGPYKIVDPGYLADSSVLSGLPAFLASAVIVASLSRLGVSQVLSFFMISTPILLFAWYYLLGWLLDRWRAKRRVVNT
jgi:hypothetical protein